MALPWEREKIDTIEDYYNLPEGTRAEFIDGQIYYMSPAPNRKHQKISVALLEILLNYIKSKEGKCEVYHAPFDVELTIMNEETKTINRHVFQPDISVICDKSKLTDQGCSGAPDWIIEIVSPGNSSHDYIKKLYYYKESGVREYWIVDPKNKSITVYFFEEDSKPSIFKFNDKIKVNISDDLYIDFNELNID